MVARRPDVMALAVARLAESGLTPQDLRRLRLEPLPAERIAGLHASFERRPGLRIPYFLPTGTPRDFYRVRYLGSPPSVFGETPAHSLRYVQPPETGTAAYFPRGHDWAKALRPGVPLFFTEGELKAACACAREIPTVGLGGVFNFQAARTGLPLLPELAAIDWVGRTVNIVFDSDYVTNPHIRVALHRFVHVLTERGALPRVVTLPELPNLSKTGLDDFLVAEGVDAFRQVVAEATDTIEARALWAWNDRFAYVRSPSPGFVVDRAAGQTWRVKDFEDGAFRHHKVTIRVPKADGSVRLKEERLPSLWLGWPYRFELERLTYEPGQPQLIDGALNLWRGWGTPAVAGDVKPWTELLTHLFQGSDEAGRAWFEKWCAYPIQNPGAKLASAVLVWSLDQGVGKSLIGETLSRLYGHDNASEIGQDDLTATFNSWVRNKQFIFGDEVTGAEGFHFADRMKKLVTNEWIRINEKYQPIYDLPDKANYYLTSNKPNAMHLEDQDRRWFVHQVTAGPAEMTFYRRYRAWMRGTGPSHLRAYLEALSLAGFDPHGKAFMTQAKQEAIALSRSDADGWLRDLRLNAASSQLPDLVTAQQLLSAYEVATGRTRLTVGGLARELLRAGFRKFAGGAYVYPHKVGAHYWILRDEKRWAKASTAAARQYLEGITASPQELAAAGAKF